MSDGKDTEKGERGRRSPSTSLSEAIGFAKQIHSAIAKGPANRETLGRALGYSSVSGAVTTKVGTLTHFNLLERVGSAYRISPLGLRVLFPKTPADEKEAIADAARAPALYGELARNYAGQALPGLLPNVLIQDYGIVPDRAEDVAKLFRQTMEYAGLLRHGILHETPGAAGAAPAPEPEAEAERPAKPSRPARAPAPAATPEPAEAAPSVEGAMVAYRVPLAGRRSAVLRLPLPLDPSDVDRIKKWLDFSADVLADTASGMPDAPAE